MNKVFNFFKLLIWFCGIWFAKPIHSQTLHAIVFADTQDAEIGIFDKQDFINVTLELNTIAAATGLHLQPYYYKGNKCNNLNLVSVLSNLKVSNNDVVFFYYSGHGTRSNDDNSTFPQLCLGSHYDSDFYPLEKILSKLSILPARLKIVIGDCCNSIASGVTPKDDYSMGPTVLSEEPVRAYCNLFLGNEGTIIASGSRAGENSNTLSFIDGTPAGGTFTVSLLNVIQTVSTQGLNANWDNVFNFTTILTYKLQEQTPIYSVRVKGVEHSSSVAPANTASYEDGNVIIQLLTAIANESVGTERRVKVMEKVLKMAFATPDAKVEIVGRNGVTIVATEKASDFVLRLCTAHNLINLVEVDGTTDKDGRYTYLKVHEIYKGY